NVCREIAGTRARESSRIIRIMRINTFLWFDGQAEEAARFYTGIFPNSRITAISRCPGVGQEHHGIEEGSVLVVAFELDGRPFNALNGGPDHPFTDAISILLECGTQEE